MDHARILKRAFQITWNYKMLWVFGIILALTTGGRGGGGNGGGGGGGGGGGNSAFSFRPFSFQFPELPVQQESTIIAMVIGMVIVAILLAVLFVVLRYVAETALIHLVDRYEATGEKVSLAEGFRIGWSRSALRVFLIDLLITLVAFVVFILLFAMAAAPLLLMLIDSDAARAMGMVMASGLGVFVIFLLIAAVIVLALLTQFFHRAAVLENLGVMESLRRGMQMVRARLGDVVIMGVILFALGLAFTIVMIPVILLLIMAAVVIGGLPAGIAWLIASQVATESVAWIAALAVGLPVFILVIVIPALFLKGVVEVFKSSTWTLTYRELLAFESMHMEALPE